MRILQATSELFPYSKTGGLADMVSGLAKALAEKGVEVDLVTPLYKGILEKFPDLVKEEFVFHQSLGKGSVAAGLYRHDAGPNLTVYFVDHREFYHRDGIYLENGQVYWDNAARFVFFSKCVVQLARTRKEPYDLIHLHDWQLGLVPALLDDAQENSDWKNPPRTLYTIHNMPYQGVFGWEEFLLTNLPEEYFTFSGLEFYGQMNLLKAGIIYSDFVSTVSETYSKEIRTEAGGAGLATAIQTRSDRVTGILNGVDYGEWNTEDNPSLPASYSATDLSGKKKCKAALQKELGLPAKARVPIFGAVTRLAPEQKGTDFILEAVRSLAAEHEMQFVLLGSGSPEMEKAFKELSEEFPKKVAVEIGYNHGLAHRIEAGIDFFLMPSRYEPAGLNQMYSLRYGTIPIVRRTGGLEDSVIDLDDEPMQANGIKFAGETTRALIRGMEKALLFYRNPTLMKHFLKNGMTADHSWNQSASEYMALYEKIATLPERDRLKPKTGA